MSKTLVHLNRLRTTKRVRADITIEDFEKLDLEDGYIVDEDVLDQVRQRYGSRYSDVINIAHWPSPSGLYIITEWDVIDE